MIVTPDTLVAALRGAPPTDNLLQLQGDFGDLRFAKRQWATPLTLDCSAATFRTLYWANVTGVRLTGGKAKGLRFDGSQLVTVDNFRIEDGPDSAIKWVRCQQVASLNCTLRNCTNGVSHAEVDRFQCSGHRISHMSADGIDVGGGWRGVISGNWIQDSEVAGGYHADGVQLWSLADKPPTSDVVISGNLIAGMTGGINCFDSSTGGTDRITIRNNLIAIAMANGIAFNNARALLLEDNRVFTAPGATVQARINPKDSQVTYKGVNSYGPWGARPGVSFPPST